MGHSSQEKLRRRIVVTRLSSIWTVPAGLTLQVLWSTRAPARVLNPKNVDTLGRLFGDVYPLAPSPLSVLENHP